MQPTQIQFTQIQSKNVKQSKKKQVNTIQQEESRKSTVATS